MPGPGRHDEIDPAELWRDYEQARKFALSTRDQPQANARTTPPSGGEGWTLTRDARARLDGLGATRLDRNRILQVARSSGDVGACRWIDERHVATAELRTAEQRLYGPRQRWHEGLPTTAAPRPAGAPGNA